MTKATKKAINRYLKSFLKLCISVLKKIVNSNKFTRQFSGRLKRFIGRELNFEIAEHRELYNLHSFYPTIQDYVKQKNDKAQGDPLISIVMPVYNTPHAYLIECIESILMQSYENWELCIADDASTDKEVIKIIKEYQKNNKKVKLIERSKNGHISEASNSALSLAKGDFVALVDHDDVLWPNALYEIVCELRRDPKVDFVYSDEDKIDGTGENHSYPFLKPDFSPEFLESCNYITHFSCIRREVISSVGGFRKGYEGAQDWDLFIRISEKTDRITHIPKLLYSWRIHEASTASDTDAKPYVYEAQRKLLEDHLTRTKAGGKVETGIIRQHRTIKYELKKKSLTDIFIKFNNAEKLEQTINSVREYAGSTNFNINVLIHKNDEEHAQDLLRFVKDSSNLITYDSHKGLVNSVYKNSTAEYIVFLDDNSLLQTNNFIDILVADAQRKGVGVVSPIILDYEGNKILSAGIGIGYGVNGYLNMLSGIDKNDAHYSRGLYAKSRRNISAPNPAVYCIKKDNLKNILNTSQLDNIIDLSVALLNSGMRHVYTPYVEVKYQGVLPEINGVNNSYKQYEDRYLNPNFDKENSYMEVKK
jgi:glycosyltransferase involved in cell wall biosynthesis